MAQPSSDGRRLIVVSLVAGAILLAVVIATGGGLSGPASSVSAPTTSGPVVTVPPATTPPAGKVQGAVSVSVRHLHGHTWSFLYTVRDLGKTPIAGFQINGNRANLFHIIGRSGWNVFGSGICGGNHQGLLVYWSTSTPSEAIRPKHTGTFGFTVNTSGTASAVYALSWGTASPQFSSTKGPIPSSLPASGSCK